MESTIQSQAKTIHQSSSAKPAIIAWTDQQAEAFEKSRFGMMALLMVLQSCLGSAACMYILQNGANVAMLSACVIATMLSNALFIAQSGAKWCLGIFYLGIVINLLLILLNF